MKLLFIFFILFTVSGAWGYTPPKLPPLSDEEMFEADLQHFENYYDPKMNVEIDKANKRIRYTDWRNEVIIEILLNEEGKYVQQRYDLNGNILNGHDMPPRDLTSVITVLRMISDACESYATDNRGLYPGSPSELLQETRRYLNTDYCEQGIPGYQFECQFSVDNYFIKAVPTSGSGPAYSIRTGSIIEEE